MSDMIERLKLAAPKSNGLFLTVRETDEFVREVTELESRLADEQAKRIEAERRLEAALKEIEGLRAARTSNEAFGRMAAKVLGDQREAVTGGVVERRLPNCQKCGKPSQALTNGYCDPCIVMVFARES